MEREGPPEAHGSAATSEGTRGDGFRDGAHAVLVVLGRVVAVLAIALGVAAFVATTLGVANRLWLRNALLGVDEVAQYSLGWFAALSGGYATAIRSHFTLNFVLKRLALRHYGLISEYLANVSALLVGVLLLAAGADWLPQAATRESITLEISLVWAYAAVPTLGALLIVFSVLRMLAGRERLAANRVRLPISQNEQEQEDEAQEFELRAAALARSPGDRPRGVQ